MASAANTINCDCVPAPTAEGNSTGGYGRGRHEQQRGWLGHAVDQAHVLADLRERERRISQSGRKRRSF